MANENKCPVMGGSQARGTTANQHWWPDQVNLRVLNKNSPLIDPMGAEFNYAEEFESLLTIGRREDAISLAREGHLEALPSHGLVVHDEDAGLRGCWGSHSSAS